MRRWRGIHIAGLSLKRSSRDGRVEFAEFSDSVAGGIRAAWKQAESRSLRAREALRSIRRSRELRWRRLVARVPRRKDPEPELSRVVSHVIHTTSASPRPYNVAPHPLP